MGKTEWYAKPVYLLVALALVLSLGIVAVPLAGTVEAQETTIVLGGRVAQAAGGASTTDQAHIGAGSWEAVKDNKFEFYIDPTAPPFDTLGSFNVDQIKSISYWTRKPGSQGDADFYLLIYTTADAVDDDASWYGYRLNAEPYFSNNLTAPADQWNEWNTDVGTNQLTFFDANRAGVGYGFYGQPSLQDIQQGTINWHDYNNGYEDRDIDYGNEAVAFISFQTGTGWMDTFEGYIDAIEIELTGGTKVTVDLEDYADEVWVDQNWTGLPDGTAVALPDGGTGYIGYNAFATIQEGIDNVAGSTVHVAPGTYVEAITIGTPNLTLQSESKWGAIIRPSTVSTWPIDGGAVVYISADGVTVDGFEIDGTTVAYNGIYGWETSGLTIKNNKIHGAVNAWDGCGILLISWGNSGTVYNNLIERNEVYDTGRMGIMVMDYGGGNYTVTSGNTITGNTVYDVWKVTWGDHGGGIQINVGKDCSITNNVIYNVRNSQRGIYMYGSAAGNIISWNTIRDNPIGIQLWISGEGGTPPINWGGETPTSPQVHCNNIHGNSDYGANSTNIQGTPMVMDAINNWWGSASGPSTSPGSGDRVSTNVTYDPWLPNEFQYCEVCGGTPPPPPPPRVPTVGHWGIFAMTALFAGLLVWTVWRRRLAS